MDVFEAISDVRRRRWAAPAETWGLVPTMGYLHEGHLSLVRRARTENDHTGVSIFVNPAQFHDAGDLGAYPRDLDRDLMLLDREGVDLVWTPPVSRVYPEGYQTYVGVEELTRPLEGRHRPGHFRGVTTMVAKLFNVFQPTRAYFGQKDAQQALAIRRMVADLDFNLEVVVCETVRESDGLAMSSRNARLSPEARAQSTCLYRALSRACALFSAGERDAGRLRETMRHIVAGESLARLEYASVADAETLLEVEGMAPEGSGCFLFSLAVEIGGVRLIDNVRVPCPARPLP